MYTLCVVDERAIGRETLDIPELQIPAKPHVRSSMGPVSGPGMPTRSL